MLISFLPLVLTDFTSDIQQEIDKIKCSPLRHRQISKHMALGTTSLIIITTETAKAQGQKLIKENRIHFLGFPRYQRFYFSSLPITHVGWWSGAGVTPVGIPVWTSFGAARRRHGLPRLAYCCWLFQSMCHTPSPSQSSTVRARPAGLCSVLHISYRVRVWADYYAAHNCTSSCCRLSKKGEWRRGTFLFKGDDV